MKFAKSILTGIGAVVLAGLILALLAPKAAHAIVATAVQVENTVASPVVSQSILPGTPFTAICFTSETSCVLKPSTPAGYTFHATYFSEFVEHSATASADAYALDYVQNGSPVGILEIGTPVIGFTITSHPVDWYIDPSTEITATLLQPSSFVNLKATVSGYLTH